MPKPPPKAGSSAAATKAKALKFIPKTVDLLRGNDAAKRKGKGKAKSILNGLADLVKGMLQQQHVAYSDTSQRLIAFQALFTLSGLQR